MKNVALCSVLTIYPPNRYLLCSLAYNKILTYNAQQTLVASFSMRGNKGQRSLSPSQEHKATRGQGQDLNSSLS